MRPARSRLPVVDSAAMDADELAIARSVLYAALFDYPLTLAQLRETLIEAVLTPTEILKIYEHSEALHSAVEYREGFFFPRGREALIAERRAREARSRRFLAHHRLLLRLVAAMPYVRLVALSGSIAHMNLEGDGDLDLFIVTRGAHVWSVTVTVIVLAKLLRRRPTLCANFVIADTALGLEQADLFTASQIVHLKPLVGDAVYRQLVATNPFVARFFPNFHAMPSTAVGFAPPRTLEQMRRAAEVLLAAPAAGAEVLCHWLYRRYLVRRAAAWRSPEHVRLEPQCLKLHTRSHRDSVLSRFDRAVRDILDVE